MFAKALIKADFNKAASNYDHYADLQNNVAGKLVNVAKNYFKIGDDLLDIGSGTGQIVKKCSRSWHITQLDIASSMCEISADLSPVINADMEVLPFKSSSFDGVISSLALQWADKPKDVFEEAYRVLKNDSFFVFSTIGPNTLKELRSTFRKTIGSDHISPFLDQKTLAGIIKNAGFRESFFVTKEIQMFYPDVMSLLKKIKGVGGNNKTDDRKNYFGKNILSKLTKIYHDKYGSSEGISASWEIFYVVASK